MILFFGWFRLSQFCAHEIAKEIRTSRYGCEKRMKNVRYIVRKYWQSGFECCRSWRGESKRSKSEKRLWPFLLLNVFYLSKCDSVKMTHSQQWVIIIPLLKKRLCVFGFCFWLCFEHETTQLRDKPSCEWSSQVELMHKRFARAHTHSFVWWMWWAEESAGLRDAVDDVRFVYYTW